MLEPDSALAAARLALESAPRIVALTGAGVSAESGIPTFRGAGGLWGDLRAEDLATPAAFARDPQRVWDWYRWRRSIVARARPNAGHLALAQFERGRTPAAFTLVTQNVDGLHTRAGSGRPIELHGNLWRLRCLDCGSERVEEAEGTAGEAEPLPRCPACGGLERPAVVWFGEALPMAKWNAAVAACVACTALLVVGTSAVVYPAAGLIEVARAVDAVVIEVNPEATAASESATYALRGTAASLLPLLLRAPGA